MIVNGILAVATILTRGLRARRLWHLMVLLALGPQFAALSLPSSAAATRYYVSAAGSDSHEGTSAARPWRTVARVNRARLEPGDEILLRGRDTHRDAPLVPSRSGARRLPVRYASFGAGKAVLTRGVYLNSVSWITLEDLALRGAGVASAVRGAGARHIRLTGLDVSNAPIGVSSPNAADARWLITGSRITHIGDSGMILLGQRITVRASSIAGTGRDPAIRYPKHGIYVRGRGVTLVGNHICGFHSQGISLRAPDARVERNVIAGGPGGIGYHDDDDASGLTRIAGNTIADVGFGVYLADEGAAGPTRERFEVIGNSVATIAGGHALELNGGGPRVETHDNVVGPDATCTPARLVRDSSPPGDASSLVLAAGVVLLVFLVVAAATA